MPSNGTVDIDTDLNMCAPSKKLLFTGKSQYGLIIIGANGFEHEYYC